MIDNSLDFSEEKLAEVALGAIGKIPLQDLINDSVSVLIEVYKAKPEIYRIDVEAYEEQLDLQANALSDVALYLKELNTPIESEDESD